MKATTVQIKTFIARVEELVAATRGRTLKVAELKAAAQALHADVYLPYDANAGLWAIVSRNRVYANIEHSFLYSLNMLRTALKNAEMEDAINDPRTDDEGNDPREWSGNSIAADHAEAIELNKAFGKAKARYARFWGSLSYWQRREKLGRDHAEALEIDALLSQIEADKAEGDAVGAAISNDIAAGIAHAEALVMNAEIDALAVKLANSRCYWWQPQTIHNVQQNVIAKYKREAFKNGPRVAQHIIKVIIIAKNIAARMKGIFEERPIDVGMPAYHELPF